MKCYEFWFPCWSPFGGLSNGLTVDKIDGFYRVRAPAEIRDADAIATPGLKYPVLDSEATKRLADGGKLMSCDLEERGWLWASPPQDERDTSALLQVFVVPEARYDHVDAIVEGEGSVELSRSHIVHKKRPGIALLAKLTPGSTVRVWVTKKKWFGFGPVEKYDLANLRCDKSGHVWNGPDWSDKLGIAPTLREPPPVVA